MTQTGATVAKGHHTTSDAAVDGLLAGAAAGIAMAAYFVVAGWLAGTGPFSILARFDPAGQVSPLTGAAIHLAVSAVYGLLFGVFYRLVLRGRRAARVRGALIGLAYGLALLLLAQALASTGAGAALREIPTVHLALAHLIYGAALGWLVARSE